MKHTTLFLLMIVLLAACKQEQTEPAATTETATGSDTQPTTLMPEDTTVEELLPEIDTTQPAATVPAGTSVIAYINSNEILATMPAVLQADKTLQGYAQQLDQELQRQQKDFQDKYVRYSQDSTASEAVINMRVREMEQLQQRLVELQYTSEQELERKKAELYAPILDRVDQAIAAVAKEQGFTHVFDAANGGLVFAEPQFNATPLVKRKLGIR